MYAWNGNTAAQRRLHHRYLTLTVILAAGGEYAQGIALAGTLDAPDGRIRAGAHGHNRGPIPAAESLQDRARIYAGVPDCSRHAA
jgi:hypothetical protein